MSGPHVGPQKATGQPLPAAGGLLTPELESGPSGGPVCTQHLRLRAEVLGECSVDTCEPMRLCHTGDASSGHSRTPATAGDRSLLDRTCPPPPQRREGSAVTCGRRHWHTAFQAARDSEGDPGHPGTREARICFDEEAEPHDVPDHRVSPARASHQSPRLTVPWGRAAWPCPRPGVRAPPWGPGPVPDPYLQRDHLHEDGEVGEV